MRAQDENASTQTTVDEVADVICDALSSWIAEPLHRMVYTDAARAAIQVMTTGRLATSRTSFLASRGD